MISWTPLPSGPASSNSRPSSEYFLSRHRRRLSENRFSCYLRSCRSRFYSVSSRTQPPLSVPLMRIRYPFVQRGRLSSLTDLMPLFLQTLQRERIHLCNVGGRPLPQPLFYPECVRLCNMSRHLLTSLSTLFLLLPPDTLGERHIRRATDSPCDPYRATLYVPRPARA
jgi:hypothetical protein